jgi:hypothetical protein
VWAEFDPENPPSLEEARTRSLYNGHFGYPEGELCLHQARCVAVAGAVAEIIDDVNVAAARAPKTAEAAAEVGEAESIPEAVVAAAVARIWEMMSATDREPFAGKFDAAAVFAAVREVHALLSGPLANKWRRATMVLEQGESELAYTPDPTERRQLRGVDP